MDWPAILERVKEWKLLHSGDRLHLTVDRARLFYESDRPGTYEFWAAYSPPWVNRSDRAILSQAGIDFPHGTLTSRHLIFEERPVVD
jgi:hypothetical protein